MLLASRANGSLDKNARWAINSLCSDNGNGSKGLAASGAISEAHCANPAVPCGPSVSVRCGESPPLPKRSSQRSANSGGVNGAMRFAYCALRATRCAPSPRERSERGEGWGEGHFVAPLTRTRLCTESCALSPLSRGEGTCRAGAAQKAQCASLIAPYALHCISIGAASV